MILHGNVMYIHEVIEFRAGEGVNCAGLIFAFKVGIDWRVEKGKMEKGSPWYRLIVKCRVEERRSTERALSNFLFGLQGVSSSYDRNDSEVGGPNSTHSKVDSHIA